MLLLIMYGILAIVLMTSLFLLPRYRHARLAHYAMKELQSRFGIYTKPARRIKPWQRRKELKYGTKTRQRKYSAKGSRKQKKRGGHSKTAGDAMTRTMHEYKNMYKV